MAYDPRTGTFRAENPSVSRRLTGLMSEQSPMMQQARTQGAQASNRRGLMNSSMGVQAGQSAAYSAAVPVASQEAQQTHETNVQGRDAQMRDVMQQRELEQQDVMHQRDLETQERVATDNRESQERIAEMNVAAHEREKAASLAAAFEQSYTHMTATIMNNHELPATTRQQYIQHSAAVRDSNLRLVEQMYGIELHWATPGSSTNPVDSDTPLLPEGWTPPTFGPFPY